MIGREFDFDLLEAVAAARRRRADRGARGGRRGARAARGRAGRPLRVHARARAGHALRRPLAAAPRAAARPGRRGDRDAAQRRRRPVAAAARAPLRAGRARRAAASGRSSTRSPPPAGRTGCWPGRRPPSTTGRRCGRASSPAPTTTRCGRELLLALGASEERAGMEREARSTRSSKPPRRRARLGDAVAARPGGARLRRPVVDPRPRRRRARGRARGGARRPRRRGRPAAGAAARAARARAVLLGRARAPARALARKLSTWRAGSATRARWRHASTPVTTRLWRPENVEERLAVAAELRQVAEETGDPELELEGAGWTVVDLLEIGDMVGADVQIAAASKLADALHRPLWRWWTSLLRCTRAQIVGDFAAAERLADESLEIGRHGQAENAVNAYAQAIFNISREQGRLARGRARRAPLHRSLSGAGGVAGRAGAAARRARPGGRGAGRVRGARRARRCRATRTG